jgi:hypothetical protein
MLLMGTALPPPDPPLEILERNPVTTDPRKRVFAFEEEREESWVLRIVWDADEPGVLEAEYRAPVYDRRLSKAEVPKFWAAVKEKVAPLGALPIESADPRP